MSTSWYLDSWTKFPALQQPIWPDPDVLTNVCDQLAAYPPLVFFEETQQLHALLAQAAQGKAFLLQGGDCAESFQDFSENAIRNKLRVMLQMAVILTYGSGRPIIKVGRIAGQFAKPRSNDVETKDGITLPAFRGDCVNETEFSEEARIPDPQRLERAYFHSASTLNMLRALTKGGFANLAQVHDWNQDFVRCSALGERYADLANQISNTLSFMESIGITAQNTPVLHDIEYFTSHEALILDYEQALTKQDPQGHYQACSAHMLWIGERTRQLDGAHVEFLRGVTNPVGCKIGPTATPDEVLRLCDRLNPHNRPGRLTLITRFGQQKIAKSLPFLLRSIKQAGRAVVWSCDPMHGNTYTANGYKTRNLEDILSELRQFFEIHQAEGTIPGGVHFELSGENVTECVGGNVTVQNLSERYQSTCDPRLNAEQSLDMAFLIADMLKKQPA